MSVANVLTLLSGVALFLFGMSLMGDGLKHVAGDRLEVLLYKLTSTAPKGILLGCGVTAVIQSSAATSVMVVGFANSGMIRFRQAIGIILGAILGTSITGWVICLSAISGTGSWVDLISSATITAVVAILGILLRMTGKNKPAQMHFGDILMGFAVLMFGMSTMSGAVSPLKESEAFLKILVTFSNPIVGILVGTLITCILQSSSAAVGILQALTMTGAVDFATAFPLVLGIAIGSSFPVILSALGANTDGRRSAWVYLVINVCGTFAAAVLFYGIGLVHPWTFLGSVMNQVTVAAMNTLFRLFTLLILTPVIPLLEKVTVKLVPERAEKSSERQHLPLEDRFLPHPALAIAQCREFISRMALNSQTSLEDAFALLEKYSDAGYKKVVAEEQESDYYEDDLGTYLVKVSAHEMTGEQNDEVSIFLHTLTDFERLSDHALNMAECAREMYNKGIVHSDEALREMAVIRAAVTDVTELAIGAFVDRDLEKAMRVEPLVEVIGSLCDEMKLHHVERIRRGVCTLEHGFVFNDLMGNFERVSDHCSNIAVAMIELSKDDFNTHDYVRSMEQVRQGSFEACHREFREKYSL